MENYYEYMNIMFIYSFLLLIYATYHKLWQRSKSTYYSILMIIGLSIVMRTMNHTIIVTYIIIAISALYARAVIRPKEKWNINQGKI